MTDRDTKFLGFAHLLYEEMRNELDVNIDYPGDSPSHKEVELLIAQRAYDLVAHVLEYSQDEVYYPPEELIEEGYIPDLTEWPHS